MSMHFSDDKKIGQYFIFTKELLWVEAKVAMTAGGKTGLTMSLTNNNVKTILLFPLDR